jgi:hypothetical protein
MKRKAHSPGDVEIKEICGGRVILPSATRKTFLGWVSLVIE